MKTPTIADAKKCLEIRIKINEGIHPVPVDHRFICWMVDTYPEWFSKIKDNVILEKQEMLQCSIS